MNVTKCINGHFFDADKYQACPHCGAVAAASENSANMTKKSHSFFGGKKKKEINNTSVVEMPDKTIGKTFGVFNAEEGIKTPKPEETQKAGPSVIISCSVCGSIYDSALHTDCPNCKSKKTEPIIEINKEAEPKSEDVPLATHTCPQCQRTYNQFSVKDKTCPHCGYDAQQTDRSIDENRSLNDAVKKVVSNNEGKTVGFFSANTKEDAVVVNNEPVVGWLVCIKGAHFGESFNIFAGRNSIGRGETNKINLAKDGAVSRSKHAWLTYEPKKRDFYIQPGEGSGLSYLNGDTIMESKKLQDKDVLEFGNGQYLLIPLCGETFTWEDYINKE